MPIEFRCEQCGRLLQAAGGTPGSRMLCSGCGAFSTIPALQPGPPFDQPTPGDAGRPSEPPPKPPPKPPAAEPASPFGPRPVDAEDAENPYLSPTQYSPAPVRQTDTKALVSFILGLSGLALSCLCCAPLGAPVGVVGLVLGIKARESESRGLAIAGIILCSIQLLLALGSVLVIAAFVIMGQMQGPGGGW